VADVDEDDDDKVEVEHEEEQRDGEEKEEKTKNEEKQRPEDDEVDNGSDGVEEEEVEEEGKPVVMEEEEEADGKVDDREEGSEAERKARRTSSAAGSPPPTTPSSAAAIRRPPPPPPPPPRPPNAAYRFLLGQGRAGHVVVMVLVLCKEWFDLYVPAVSHLLAWSTTKLLFVATGGGRRDDYEDERDLMLSSSRRSGAGSSSLLSSRTGQSSRQRKKQIRRDDQAALEQLKRLSTASTADAASSLHAKYKYVSLDFLKRHKLGPYGTRVAASREGVVDVELDESTGLVGVVDVVGVARKPAVSTTIGNDEDDDIDWVIEALTGDPKRRKVAGTSSTRKKKKKKRRRKTTVIPSVGVALGSDGTQSVNVGVELSFGGGKTNRSNRQSLAEIVRDSSLGQLRNNNKSRTRPRIRDRQGGDGVFGRLRAATGANSMMSRSLLGAYPGDAVPPGEAGSALGIEELAERYGYGEWSDDDDEEPDNYEEEMGGLAGSNRKSKRIPRKRRRRQSPEPDEDEGASFSFSSSSGSTRTKRRRATSSSNVGVEFSFGSRSGPAREFGDSELFQSKRREEPALSTLRTLNGSSRPNRDRVPDDVRIVRPAMDRVNELKSRKKRRDDDGGQ